MNTAIWLCEVTAQPVPLHDCLECAEHRRLPACPFPPTVLKALANSMRGGRRPAGSPSAGPTRRGRPAAGHRPPGLHAPGMVRPAAAAAPGEAQRTLVTAARHDLSRRAGVPGRREHGGRDPAHRLARRLGRARLDRRQDRPLRPGPAPRHGLQDHQQLRQEDGHPRPAQAAPRRPVLDLRLAAR